MANVKDKVHLGEVVHVELTRVRTEPEHPCPDCGAETVSHENAPMEESTDRICSKCREIQSAMDEVPRVHTSDSRPRFPCAKCGSETTRLRSGKKGPIMKRICVRPSCRKVT